MILGVDLQAFITGSGVRFATRAHAGAITRRPFDVLQEMDTRDDQVESLTWFPWKASRTQGPGNEDAIGSGEPFIDGGCGFPTRQAGNERCVWLVSGSVLNGQVEGDGVQAIR